MQVCKNDIKVLRNACKGSSPKHVNSKLPQSRPGCAKRLQEEGAGRCQRLRAIHHLPGDRPLAKQLVPFCCVLPSTQALPGMIGTTREYEPAAWNAQQALLDGPVFASSLGSVTLMGDDLRSHIESSFVYPSWLP